MDNEENAGDGADNGAVDLGAVLPGGEPAGQPADASGADNGSGEGDPLEGILPSGKGDGDAPAQDGGENGGKEAAKKDAPEDKPLEINIPDGIEKDDEMLTGFLATAKESGMGQEQAQKMFDMHLASQKRMVERYEENFRASVAKIDAEFAAQCRTDAEFGGKNFEASRNYAQAAIRRFIPDPKEQKEFAQFYREANLQNSPHLFRLFARIGRETGEATPPRDEVPHIDKNPGPGDYLFPNLPSAKQG